MLTSINVDTPCDLLALHCAAPERYPFLLESVARGAATARYDILFAFPGETLELADGSLSGAPTHGSDFLARFDSGWGQKALTQDPAPQWPFSGGWFVYLGYELAAQIEPTLHVPGPDRALPTAFATRIPAAFIKDHHTQQLFAVAETAHGHLVEMMQADAHAAARARAPAPMQSLLSAALTEEAPERYLEGVRRVLRYIRDGDVFQVNLSRLWQGRLRAGVSAADVYRRLREHNPAPFAALVRYRGAHIISSSPERLVRVRAGRVETRPIAGTRARDPQADARDTTALLAHPKERAEHIMLIDLERNDLGRVCIPGSVAVDELMAVESYAHVHHIVSNVHGRLRSDVTPGQVLRAVFPGGTITGCPKVRCMEIIAELEQAPRGAYTGALGYINRDGSMDFNILIRTLVQQGSAISLRAGAGIVADSNAQRELAETRAKARGMILALGE